MVAVRRDGAFSVNSVGLNRDPLPLSFNVREDAGCWVVHAAAAQAPELADVLAGTTTARERQNVQFMLGERHVGLDDVPIVRTVVRAVPAVVRLASNPQWFHLMASVLDIALDDLGDDEWEARTGAAADTARTVAARLREEVVPAANASWHQLDATADKLAAVRSALVELAYGTTRIMPTGISRLGIIDVLEELDRQLGR